MSERWVTEHGAGWEITYINLVRSTTKHGPWKHDIQTLARLGTRVVRTCLLLLRKFHNLGSCCEVKRRKIYELY